MLSYEIQYKPTFSRIYSLPQPDSLSGSPSYRFSRPDELELRLDDDREREALLRLLLASSAASNNRAGNSNNGLNDEISSLLNLEDEVGQDNDLDGEGGDEDAINLGSFQRPVASPYWSPSVGRTNEINLMSSLLAAEPPRTSGSSHGLYGLEERTALPLDIGIARRALAYRDEGDNGNVAYG